MKTLFSIWLCRDGVSKAGPKYEKSSAAADEISVLIQLCLDDVSKTPPKIGSCCRRLFCGRLIFARKRRAELFAGALKMIDKLLEIGTALAVHPKFCRRNI